MTTEFHSRWPGDDAKAGNGRESIRAIVMRRPPIRAPPGACNQRDPVVTRSAAPSFNLAQHCLGRQAAERGAKTALILCDGPDAFRSWTYGELDLKVRKLAGGLIESGLKKGDRVMIRAENDIGFVLAFFATVAIGCVAQPASPLLTAEEALALAEDSGAAAIFLGNAG